MSPVDQDVNRHTVHGSSEGRIRVRIVKRLPAPVMDDFNVGKLREGHVYDLDERVARYLIVSGYAVRVKSQDSKEKPNKP